MEYGEKQNLSESEMAALLEKQVAARQKALELKKQADLTAATPNLKYAKTAEEKKELQAKAKEQQDAIMQTAKESEQALNDMRLEKLDELHRKTLQKEITTENLRAKIRGQKIGEMEDKEAMFEFEAQKTGEDTAAAKEKLIKDRLKLQLESYDAETKAELAMAEASHRSETDLALMRTANENERQAMIRKTTMEIRKLREEAEGDTKSPVQTIEEMVKSINAEMGVGRGAFGISNLGVGGELGRGGSLLSDMMESTYSAVGSSIKSQSPFKHESGHLIDKDHPQRDTSVQPRSISGPDSHETVVHRVEFLASGAIKMEGPLSETTANGVLSDMQKQQRLLGNKNIRTGRGTA